MRNRTLSIVAASLLAVAAGCSSGSSSISFGSLDREFAEAVCRQLAQCPNPGPSSVLMAYLARNPGLYSCADLFERGGAVSFGTYQSSIDAGRIVYDGGAAAACLDLVGSACGDGGLLLASSAECQRVFTGTVPLDGACSLDLECAGDAHCDLETMCPGTCKAAPTLGEACSMTNPCSDRYPGADLQCMATVGNPTEHCVAVTATTVGAGGSCGDVDAVGDEQVQAACEPGLYCKMALGASTGTCALPIPLGQTCVPTSDVCVENSVCKLSGAAGFRCEAFTVATTTNVTCDEANGQFCDPLSRLECAGGTCELVGSGAANQPCRQGFPTDCNEGLYCDTNGVDPICLPLIADGLACDPTVSEACVTGYCDDVTNPAMPVCGVAPLCD